MMMEEGMVQSDLFYSIWYDEDLAYGRGESQWSQEQRAKMTRIMRQLIEEGWEATEIIFLGGLLSDPKKWKVQLKPVD